MCFIKNFLDKVEREDMQRYNATMEAIRKLNEEDKARQEEALAKKEEDNDSE